jgi:hypothetical protein
MVNTFPKNSMNEPNNNPNVFADEREALSAMLIAEPTVEAGQACNCDICREAVEQANAALKWNASE